MGLLSNIFPYLKPSASSVSDLKNPALWLQNALLGGKTVSGENVTHTTAFSLSAYYACIRTISEDLAKLPLNLYRRIDPQGKELARDHPVFRLLRSEPNPDMSSFSFRETLQHWELGQGNGFAEIERDGEGRPFALWPIHPSRVRATRDGNRNLMYEVRTGDIEIDGPERNIETVAVRSENMFHIHGMGGNGIMGYSVLAFMAESLGVSLAAQNFSAGFFANDATPGVVLIHPETLDEPARENIRHSWDRVHKGAGQSSRTAVLEEGMKIERLTIPPNEAQLLETKSWQTEEISRWFRMPPHKIQHLANASFSNIESENRTYVDDTLLPHMVRWEEEISRKLLFDEEKQHFFAEHNVDSLLRGDSAARANLYRTLFNLGSISPNDIRDKENLNPIPDGENYFIQQNMTTLSALVANPPVPGGPPKNAMEEEEPEDNDDPSDDSNISDTDNTSDNGNERDDVDNLHPVLLAAADRVIKKESKALERTLKKYGDDKAKFSVWASKFHSEQSSYILSCFEPILSTVIPGYDIDNMQNFAMDIFCDIEIDIRSMFGKDNNFNGFESKWTEILFQRACDFLRNEKCLFKE